MQKRLGCQVVSRICGFAWFHIENETGRLMVTLRGDLTDFKQPVFDRVADLPVDVQAKFLELIDGEFAIEDAGEFDRVIRLSEQVFDSTACAEFCQKYGCD